MTFQRRNMLIRDRTFQGGNTLMRNRTFKLLFLLIRFKTELKEENRETVIPILIYLYIHREQV